jgi:hypothetical protein
MATTARQAPISPPRGMSRRQAAAYWGVSPGTFAKMVRLGIAPQPMVMPGITRRVYDRDQIDTAITAQRAIRADRSTGTAG